MEIREHKLPIDSLLLDPNNYRFQDLEGYVSAAENRFHEDSVQTRVSQRLRKEEGLSALKESILTNGFIPVERIVVRPYVGDKGKKKWIVVEGNRRVAAVKWILDDQDAGVEIDEKVMESIDPIHVVITEESNTDELFRASLMGIRHVSGINEWGGYQRAKLVMFMRDDLSLSAQEVASRIGMTGHEVARRYRAFKALEQMREDEIYGEFAKPSLYPLFHEAVSVAKVKEWLTWNEQDSLFESEDHLEQFYGLISPSTDEEEQKLEPKIKSHKQVRELRYILENLEAKSILLDPNKDFSDATLIVRQEELSRLWVSEVAAAIRALETIGVHELKTLSPDDLEVLKLLKSTLEERFSDYKKLRDASTD